MLETGHTISLQFEVSFLLIISINKNMSTKSGEHVTHQRTSIGSLFVYYSRNDDGKVVVDMEIIFGQYVEMELFITLYRALHMNGSFVDLPVQPIWDNSKLALYNSI